MSLSGAPAVGGTTLVYVGSVWVVAHHLLVTQALVAALGRRIADVRALPWESQALREAGIDAREDVLLVVDDVRSSAALASVRVLLRAAPSRSLVMTEQPRGYAWGGLLDAGATEIVSEPQSVEELAEVIERVRAGDAVISEDERRELLDVWTRHLELEEELMHRMATLSSRELTVLESLASGSRPIEVGQALGVAQSTVRTHIRSIRRKLGVDSQLRAVLVLHRLRSRVPPTPPDLPSQRRPQE